MHIYIYITLKPRWSCADSVRCKPKSERRREREREQKLTESFLMNTGTRDWIGQKLVDVAGTECGVDKRTRLELLFFFFW